MGILLTFGIGIISWPVLEYLLHRFLGHVFKVNTLFKKEHTRHHAETNYFAPLNYKFLAAIPVTSLSVVIVSKLTNSWPMGISFTGGFLTMFTTYEWFHWSIHAKSPKTKLGLRLRKHHLAHHFHSPKMNHGVTTIIIDKMMGTYLPVQVVKIPRNVKLPWLHDTNQESIAAKYSDDFQFR